MIVYIDLSEMITRKEIPDQFIPFKHLIIYAFTVKHQQKLF